MADIEKTKDFLSRLFGGREFERHGYKVDIPMPIDNKFPVGTVIERVDLMSKSFEAELKLTELIDDDRIPCLHIWSGTEVFAEAFGSPVHFDGNNMPFALPTVYSAEEADKLHEPDIFDSSLGRIFEIGDKLVERFGNVYPVRICDIQSPLDIAALIWEKEQFFLTIYEAPDAVLRLVEKVTNVVERFVEEFKRRYFNCCLVHYPYYWMPPEFGICLSEDEVGSISPQAFEKFSLPYLNRLSASFGGISLHCCANSIHQWNSFLKLNRLVTLNLVRDFDIQVKSIRKFSGKAVLIPQGFKEIESTIQESIKRLLLYAREDTRFFFCCNARDVDEARQLSDDLRIILQKF